MRPGLLMAFDHAFRPLSKKTSERETLMSMRKRGRPAKQSYKHKIQYRGEKFLKGNVRLKNFGDESCCVGMFIKFWSSGETDLNWK